MMSEENTETSLESLPPDAMPVEVRQHPLPWVLFGVSLLLLSVVGVVLARRANTESARASVESSKRVAAEKSLAMVEGARDEANAKVGDLELQVKAANDLAANLATQLKVIEDQKARAAKPQAPAKKAPPPAKKKTAPPPKKKKK